MANTFPSIDIIVKQVSLIPTEGIVECPSNIGNPSHAFLGFLKNLLIGLEYRYLQAPCKLASKLRLQMWEPPLEGWFSRSKQRTSSLDSLKSVSR